MINCKLIMDGFNIKDKSSNNYLIMNYHISVVDFDKNKYIRYGISELNF